MVMLQMSAAAQRELRWRVNQAKNTLANRAQGNAPKRPQPIFKPMLAPTPFLGGRSEGLCQPYRVCTHTLIVLVMQHAANSVCETVSLSVHAAVMCSLSFSPTASCFVPIHFIDTRTCHQ